MERRDFIASKVAQAMKAEDYWQGFEQSATENKGVKEGYGQYISINHTRSTRWFKTGLPQVDEMAAFSQKNINEIWLVLTEYWCGDAAHNLPFVQMLANSNPHIEVLYLLRDQHLDLMDDYLSDTGGRSIPVVIRIEKESYQELGKWGPRPANAQELFLELKKSERPLQEQINELQKWYNADKGHQVIRELLAQIL